MNKYNEHTDIYDVCEQHMHAYVLLEMKDGMEADGIITGIDHEHVYVAIPVGGDAQQSMRHPQEEERQYGHYHGGSGGGYGGYGGYGGSGYYGNQYNYGRPRRFERWIVPLTALAAVSLLPWY